MINMKRAVSVMVLAICCHTEAGLGQDVAAPVMPNVDLETEEGKKMAAYEEAVDRHCCIGLLCSYIILEEMEERGGPAMYEALLRSVQTPEWMKSLDACPADYRAMHLKIIKKSKDLLDRIGKEKMDEGQLMEAYGKLGKECMELGAGVMEKYQLYKYGKKFFKMTALQMGGNKEERLKNLYRMKEELISGKMKLPVKDSGMEDEI